VSPARTPVDVVRPEDAATARRLGDVLVEAGLVSAQSLARALESRASAPPSRRRLGHLLVDRGLASEDDVGRAMADLLDLPFVDLTRVPVSDDAARIIPRAVAQSHGLLVLGVENGRATVATHDPQNVVALDDVRLHTGAQRIDVVVAAEGPLRRAIATAWAGAAGARAVITGDLVGETNEPDPDTDLAAAAEEAPIVRLAGRILADAVRARASDIHVEPQQDDVRIRYRVDGVLREVRRVPSSSRAALTSRLKLIAGMDISERRIPQDGRVRLEVGEHLLDARVSTLPSMHGEKVVIRLLASADDVAALGELGVDPRALRTLRRVLDSPQGLVLITGPTGSGKTSTLFSALRAINNPERNIITLEDPVEIQLPGLTQVQVNEKTGLTFARGLRSILRQDPDVVLVGEIRDLETAELAMRASLTGHLVLATLHTNDAVSAISRLVDMGIQPYLVASALSLVVAQRLVRTVCPECAEDYSTDPALLSDDGSVGVPPHATPRRGTGCARCDHTGYLGRRGVYEVVEITPNVRRTLLAEPTESALAAATRDAGAASLREEALRIAAAGATTYEEAVRVTIEQADL
jgi:type IV pilus assembly protein PilB